MKDKLYRPFSFRLDEKTVKELEELRGELTWNRLFLRLIRKEKGYKCEICGDNNDLEIHHKVSKKEGGNDEESNKQFLCITCHKKTKNWGNKKIT